MTGPMCGGVASGSRRDDALDCFGEKEPQIDLAGLGRTGFCPARILAAAQGCGAWLGSGSWPWLPCWSTWFDEEIVPWCESVGDEMEHWKLGFRSRCDQKVDPGRGIR